MPAALAPFGVALGLILLAYSPCRAHDYWVESDGQDYLLFRGHRYSEHPRGAHLDGRAETG